MRSWLIAVVLAVSLCGVAIASDNPVVCHSTTQVKGATGVVYGMIVSYKAVTAGDSVELKCPDTAFPSVGTKLIRSVAYNTNWTDSILLPRGVNFPSGIHCHVTTTTGNAMITILYE